MEENDKNEADEFYQKLHALVSEYLPRLGILDITAVLQANISDLHVMLISEGVRAALMSLKEELQAKNTT